jgi:hypothetical protein
MNTGLSNNMILAMVPSRHHGTLRSRHLGNPHCRSMRNESQCGDKLVRLSSARRLIRAKAVSSGDALISNILVRVVASCPFLPSVRMLKRAKTVSSARRLIRAKTVCKKGLPVRKRCFRQEGLTRAKTVSSSL